MFTFRSAVNFEIAEMDHIYPTKDYKVYNIKDEAEKLKKSVSENGSYIQFADIPSFAGCSGEKTRKIALDIFQTSEDYEQEKPEPDLPSPFNKFTPEAMNLNCTKALREAGLKIKELKFKEFETKPLEASKDKAEQIEDEIPALSEVVITLRFYEPFKYLPNIKNQPRFHLEYQVLGSNLLTELRDKFFCVCNFGPFFDISEDPLRIHEPAVRSDPGFFFVHDTFYNDTRNALNCDYSDVIIKWYKKMSYVRVFKTAPMEDTKFEDLQVRFGYPCVYQHQGACEHTFCITSIDLIDATFDLNRKNYPKLIRCSNKHSNLCDLCNQTESSYQVTNCPLHVRDPLNVCETCFFSFHYNRDRTRKVCDFQAYRIYSLRPDSFDQSDKI